MRNAIVLGVLVLVGAMVFAADRRPSSPGRSRRSMSRRRRDRGRVEAVLVKAPKHEGALRHLNILLVPAKGSWAGEHDYQVQKSGRR